jgi:hypothetical protein
MILQTPDISGSWRAIFLTIRCCAREFARNREPLKRFRISDRKIFEFLCEQFDLFEEIPVWKPPTHSARLNLHRFRNSADRGHLAAPLHLHRQEQRSISTRRFFMIFKDFVFGRAEVFPNKYDERLSARSLIFGISL